MTERNNLKCTPGNVRVLILQRFVPEVLTGFRLCIYSIVIDVAKKDTRISGANGKGQMLYTSLPNPGFIKLEARKLKLLQDSSLVSIHNRIRGAVPHRQVPQGRHFINRLLAYGKNPISFHKKPKNIIPVSIHKQQQQEDHSGNLGIFHEFIIGFTPGSDFIQEKHHVSPVERRNRK